MCIACYILCKSRGRYSFVCKCIKKLWKDTWKLTVITCDGVGGGALTRATGGRETFYCVLLRILNFELCEAIIYSNFEGEGIHRYDLRYIVIEVQLKWFRYARVILFDSLICCKPYQS